MPKTASHRGTLDRIKQSSARNQPVAQEPGQLACRREFRRERTSESVQFSLHDRSGASFAWGSGILIDYSPQGALLGSILFDEGFWPDGDFSVAFRITGGPHEGVHAYGTPVRFATSKASLAVRFDGIYVKL